MRPIKFRAWNDRVKEMEVILSLHWLFNEDTEKFDKLDIVTPKAQIRDQPNLMQFTGLLDKNGKEIWEGDIVKNNWTNINGKFIGDIWQIKFGGYDDSDLEWGSPAIGFYAENKHGDQQSPLNLQTDNNKGIETIGNIYENPELLTEVK